jgi:hypothetical protein
MRKIVVSVDDETYRRANLQAAQRGTSAAALVARYLAELAAIECDYERLKREEQELRARIRNFNGGDRLPRHEVHERIRDD